jgi:dipeptidyl aminopeptidase/acylaminoacyl peptidase
MAKQVLAVAFVGGVLAVTVAAASVLAAAAPTAEGVVVSVNRPGVGGNGLYLTREHRWIGTIRGLYPAWSARAGLFAYERAGAVYVVGPDGRGERRIAPWGATAPSWSPDGRRIAYPCWDEHKVGACTTDVRTGGTLWLARYGVASAVEDVPAARWSPDGSRIAFLRLYDAGGPGKEDVVVVDLRSGRRRVVATDSTLRLADIAWSPDGRRLAYWRVAFAGVIARCAIVVVDAATHAERAVPVPRCLRAVPDSTLLFAPDGAAVAYVLRHALEVAPLDGSAHRRLAFPSTNPRGADWYG